jgi:hypothetical protein
MEQNSLDPLNNLALQVNNLLLVFGQIGLPEVWQAQLRSELQTLINHPPSGGFSPITEAIKSRADTLLHSGRVISDLERLELEEEYDNVTMFARQFQEINQKQLDQLRLVCEQHKVKIEAQILALATTLEQWLASQPKTRAHGGGHKVCACS